MERQTPELLAPAGSMESALAAINAGADALYLGGKNFSARNLAQNFTDDELVNLIEYAALRSVRVYIAVNTLYKNAEIPRVLDFVSHMYKEGAAAFILQDPGLAYILKSHFPQVEIHASTQMSVHSTTGVNFMEKMGFSRVVLSRELSLDEVTDICRETNIECEVFVHGALCISYSGQCLMSSLIGGRSGNRGKCAQICRTKFQLGLKSGYLLSPKDMMTLELLGDIVATGVSSLKIEGRMKSPEYVYLVTKAYRLQLDKIAAGDKTPVSGNTIGNLLQIFNRGGSFSTGYYNNYAGIDMMSTVTPKSSGVLVGEVAAYKNGKCKINFTKPVSPGDGIEIWTTDGNHVGTGISKKIAASCTAEFVLTGAIEKGNNVYKSYNKGLIDVTKREMAAAKRKHAVTGCINAIAGQNLKLKLSVGDVAVEKLGDIVEAAQNAPMGIEEITGQLSKTGNTPFEITFSENNIDDNIFVSKSTLNKLRRETLEKLETKIIQGIKKIPLEKIQVVSDTNHLNFPTGPRKLSAQINCASHLAAVVSQDISRVYINYTPENIAVLSSISGSLNTSTQIFLALSTISRNSLEKELKATLIQLESTNIDGYLVSTYGQLYILQEMGTQKQIMLNYTFNIFNNWAVEYFRSMGCGVTLSQELNIHEINSITTREFELVVYGRQILMSTHNCPIGLYGKCENKKTAGLIDKTGANFPIMTDCHNCIAHILNGKVLDTSPKFLQIKNTGAESFRLIFTTEDENTIDDTITRFKQALAGTSSQQQHNDYTYGHFFRGVE